MSKVRYTSRALDDIDALLLFMAEHNMAGRGAAFVDRVACYRVIDEDAENGATVEMLRIIDGRRDLGTVFFTG